MKKQTGFTLIELLIVVAILLILAGIAFAPGVDRYTVHKNNCILSQGPQLVDLDAARAGTMPGATREQAAALWMLEQVAEACHDEAEEVTGTDRENNQRRDAAALLSGSMANFMAEYEQDEDRSLLDGLRMIADDD